MKRSITILLPLLLVALLALFLYMNSSPTSYGDTTYARLSDRDGAVLLIAYDVNCGVYFTPDLVSGQVKYTSRQDDLFALKTKYSPDDGQGQGLDLEVQMIPDTLIIVGRSGEKAYSLGSNTKFHNLPFSGKDYISSEDVICDDIVKTMPSINYEDME